MGNKRMTNNTVEDMKLALKSLEEFQPDSRLIPLFKRAIEKGAVICLEDDIWKMTYKKKEYLAERTEELSEILK